jgi:hypothetical protein
VHPRRKSGVIKIEGKGRLWCFGNGLMGFYSYKQGCVEEIE